jgi:hypothetical protein
MKFYPDAGEEIPKDLPPEKGPRFRMTLYVDFDHAYDLVTRRSIIGILDMLKTRVLDRYIKVRRQFRRKLIICQ